MRVNPGVQPLSCLLPGSCSRSLADNAVVSRVNGQLWDLDRPLEEDCSLEFLRFEDEDAQAVSLLLPRLLPAGGLV